MPIVYPMQQIGCFGLGLGFVYKFIHDRYGFDLGERFHHDIHYRIQTIMEIDRVIYSDFGELGVGYANPFPRVSIEPYGHRFMPAMFGSEIRYAVDQEPWCVSHSLTGDDIEKLEPWTLERIERAEPVRLILSQYEEIKKKYDRFRIPDDVFNPHYRTMSTLQNLGSVINTAFSVLGDDLFIYYMDSTFPLHRFYRHITDLMLGCLRFFPQRDGWPLDHVFIGNCTVAMISPNQYATWNLPYDKMIMEYARSIQANFMMHQDSHVNPHLENYAQFSYIQAFDVGQDTDFERLLSLSPDVAVNCILLPSWLMDKTGSQIRQEMERLMMIGKRFRQFSFGLLEIDLQFSHHCSLFDFYEIFKECSFSVLKSKSACSKSF